MPSAQLKWFLLALLLGISTQALAQPEFTNARLSGNEGSDSIIDEAGNLIHVGYFFDSWDVDEDGTPDLFSRGGSDLFIQSVAPDGSLNWIRTAGSTVESINTAFGIRPTDQALRLVQDEEGNLYMAGRFHDAIDFDHDRVIDISASDPDTSGLFIAKYTSGGTFEWAQAFGGNNDTVSSLEYSHEESAFILTGTRFSYADAPGGLLLARISPGGTFLDERAVPLSELNPQSKDYSIAYPLFTRLDNANNMYILGRYKNSTGSYAEFYLAKYNAAFELQWLRYSSGPSLWTIGFLVDDEDHVWISGGYIINPFGRFSISDADSTYEPPTDLENYSIKPGFFAARYSPEGAIDCVRFVTNTYRYGSSADVHARPGFILQPFPPSVVIGVVDNGELDLNGDTIPDLESGVEPVTLFLSLSRECSYEWAWHSPERVRGYGATKKPDGSYMMTGYFQGEQLSLDGLEDEPAVINPGPFDYTLARFAADFTFMDPTLPVELVGFSALQDQASITLSWETASETNNAGFEVQQTQNHGSWQAVAFIAGAGTTDQPQQYAHTLSGLDPGVYQFRLKQIDFDGTVEYSEVESIHRGQDQAFVLSAPYPNPFNPQSTFTLSVSREQNVRIELYDMSGKKVETIFVGLLPANTTHEFTINGTQLSSGSYLYRVEGDYFTSSRQVLLVK